MKSAKRRSASNKRNRTFSRRQRLLLAGGVGAVALLLSIGVALTWESAPPIPPERLVRVYLQHGCVCAPEWMDELKASGFVVEPLEASNMHLLRRKMQVPDHLQGCHLGEYLGYFLDGHIPVHGLHVLAKQRPAARGIGMASDMVVVNAPIASSATNKDAMIIFDNAGQAQLWKIDAVPETSPTTGKSNTGASL